MFFLQQSETNVVALNECVGQESHVEIVLDENLISDVKNNSPPSLRKALWPKKEYPSIM